MDDRRIDSAELPEDLRQMVRECEVTGRRTIYTRAGKPVATLVSYDEYLALRETIALSEEPEILGDLVRGEEEARRGALLAPEDLLVE